MGFREQIAANEEEAPEVIEETIPAEKAEDTPAEGEELGTKAEGGEPEELEEWQKADADGEPGGDSPKFPKSLKAKKKLRGLLDERETELTEHQKENERLRLENEQLRAKGVQGQDQLKRPVESDFEDGDGDVDYVKYNAALDEYDDLRYEQRQAGKQAKANHESIKESISEGVDAHYNRAEELVESSGINPDVYKSADIKFRKAVEDIYPKKGDAVANALIATLGEGSEKAVFFVGNNDTAREKFQTLLRNDTSGIKAAVFMGREMQRLETNSPAKRISKAKAPASNIKGDAPAGGVSGKLQKQYAQAHKEGNAGKAIKIKRQAKAAKVDTSSW